MIDGGGLEAKWFVFHIFSNDHDPSHVHVYKGGEKIVINLGDKTSPPSFVKRKRKTYMTEKNAAKAWKIVAVKQNYLLKMWGKIHG